MTPSSGPSEAAQPPSRRARRVAALVAVVVVATIGVVTALVVRDSTGTPPAKGLEEVARPSSAMVGEPAPDFEIEGLHGGTVRLSDFRGKPVVLNFWASWCNPCRKEFPLFRSTLADKGGAFEMVGVDTADIRRDARRFVEEQRADWPIGFDGDKTVARGYGVDPLPQTFFIRSDGTIASHVIRGIGQAEFLRELRKIGVE